MEKRLSNEIDSSSDDDLPTESRVSELTRQFESGVGKAVESDALERWGEEKQGATH